MLFVFYDHKGCKNEAFAGLCSVVDYFRLEWRQTVERWNANNLKIKFIEEKLVSISIMLIYFMACSPHSGAACQSCPFMPKIKGLLQASSLRLRHPNISCKQSIERRETWYVRRLRLVSLDNIVVIGSDSVMEIKSRLISFSFLWKLITAKHAKREQKKALETKWLISNCVARALSTHKLSD